jgi:hypothetical protein
VDSYEGPAELVWVANPAFALQEIVNVKISVTATGWSGHLTAAEPTLLYWGNPFELHFPDGRKISMGAGEPDDHGVFPIWEWDTRPEPTSPCPLCDASMRRTGGHMGGGDEAAHVFECSACSSRHMRPHTGAPWTPSL